MADLTGHTLDRYMLTERIGRGGMADVYRAHQESMDRDVAIKVLATELGGNEEFIARFEREARVIARLQHPHILPVIDFGRSGEYVYLVMRLVEGGVLSARLLQQTLSLVEANRLLQQVASALAYAHQHGVIHRDLKPTNILLDETDNAYLTDFGIAKMLAGATGGQQLTNTGQVMGTPAYMAPEQWRSEAVDARTDIYALGVILYEMLMGALPFQAETPFSMMYKHFDTPPPPPRAINPQISPAIERVLLRALAKNPDDRYAAATTFADDFERAVKAMPADTATHRLPRATPDQIVRATPAPLPRSDISPVAPPAQVIPPPVFAPSADARPAPRSRARRRVLIRGLTGVVVIATAITGVWLAANTTDDHDDPGGTQAATGVMFPTGPGTSITASPGSSPTANTPSPTSTPHLPGSAEALAMMQLTATAEYWTRQPPDTPDFTLPPPPTRTAIWPTSAPTLTLTPLPTISPRPPADTPTPSPTGIASCGGMDTHMQADTGGRTTLYPDIPTRVRGGPGTDNPILRLVDPGQMFWVFEGPECVDDMFWWHIEGIDASGNWFGWIAEGQDGEYWIEPYDTGPLDCPGAPPPRLTPGKQGRVTLDPADPSRLRIEPHTDAAVIDLLQPGDTFTVISGPICQEGRGWRWWLVEADDLQGWLAEGTPGAYWLEPVP